MKVQGEHDLPFPRQEVWEALMDPELLSRTLPGCEELQRTGEGTYRGVMRVQVGPVRGVFQGDLEMTDLDPPAGYRMRLKGQGPTGFMDGEGTIALAETEGGRSSIRYDLDFAVGGRVAGVGQRVLDASARSVARQGLEGLEREIAARKTPASAAAAAAAAAPAAVSEAAAPEAAAPRPAAPSQTPSQSQMARRIALDVAADLVPPQQRSLLLGGGLVLLGVLLGWLLRGRR